MSKASAVNQPSVLGHVDKPIKSTIENPRYRIGDWIIHTDGISHLGYEYEIEKSQLNDADWEEHMARKSWVNISDFRKALALAKELVKEGTI